MLQKMRLVATQANERGNNMVITNNRISEPVELATSGYGSWASELGLHFNNNKDTLLDDAPQELEGYNTAGVYGRYKLTPLGNLEPQEDSVAALGSATKRIKGVYADNYRFGNWRCEATAVQCP